MRASRVLAVLLSLALPAGVAVHAHAEDAAASYRSNANPAGAWTYGWSAGPGQPLTPFSLHTATLQGLDRWSAADGASISRTCGGYYQEGIEQPVGALTARPAPGGAATVLRWTAPATASYRLNAVFTPLAQPAGATTPANLAGTQASGQFGAAVANAGDVNGDGFDDLLVGEPLYDGGQTNEGRVRLYRGSRGGPGPSAAWSYESNQAGAQFGFCIAGLGDVNGDGYDDVAVGAPLYDPAGGTADAGMVFVFLGSATGLPAVPSWSASGPPTGSQLGYALAGAADVNGDGFGDVIAGAPYVDDFVTNEGAVYLWKGSAAGLGAPGTAANAAWSVEGNLLDARMGQAVACVGDVDGDGRDDVLVSAPGWDMPSADMGQTWLYRGSAAGIEALPAWAHSGAAGDQYGSVLAHAGDLNGDGRVDLVIGSPSYAFGQGKVDVYVAGPAGFPATPTRSIVAGLGFGRAIAGLGDVNRDARADVAIGEVSGFGTVRLYHGNATSGLADTPTNWTGGPGYDVGRAIAGGDYNSDAERDVALGQPLFDAAFTDMGRVAVVRQIVAGAGPATTCLAVVLDGTTVAAQGAVSTAGPGPFRHVLERAFVAGETVDFAVTDGGDGAHTDAVRCDVMALAPGASTGPLGPAVEFAGERFVVSKGPQSFGSAAFDAANRRIASQGAIRDLCNQPVTPAGPPGESGLAWDVVTQHYLSLDPDGNGNWLGTLWDTTGVVVDTLFTLPPVFTVPGVGPDTLETPRGVAVDASHVYVVESGPPGVEPYPNAWFKFTRAGVPVAGREGAAFSVNATHDVVDDIVWSPPGSSISPGTFLAVVEHTGLFVLDASGALLSQRPWAEMPGSSSFRPTAFAGLALDPARGDLYLVDNDMGRAQVWTRLPSTGVARSLIGTSGGQAYVRDPASGCNNPLWRAYGDDAACGTGASLIFGIAYRPADARVYGCDYAGGDLWRFDPLAGRTERVGPTGRTELWGMACDLERDQLYSFDNATQTLIRIDPRTAEATSLGPPTTHFVDDLAYVRELDAVFGVDVGVSPPRLVRFDPASGAATVAGPTQDARGLEYDPTIGALVATTTSDELWRIDPATGSASLVKRLEGASGWEGLAVAPVAPLASVDAPTAPGPRASVALRIGPNPTRSGAVIRFTLAGRDAPEVCVLDLAGRLVRRLGGAPLHPGEHSIWWDGRDGAGHETAPGVYFVRLQAGAATRTASLVRIR